MDMKNFKILVKKLDEEIKAVYGEQRFTYLDYEFTAMRLIEQLDQTPEIKRKLRIKFSNKAKQMYYNERANGFGNISLMDRFDFFGEEESSKKVEITDLGTIEFLGAMDELFQAMIEEKESSQPTEEEMQKLSKIIEDEDGPDVIDEDEALEKAYKEAIEEEARREELLNRPPTPEEMAWELEDTPEIYEDDTEVPLEDLTEEELKDILDEIDDNDIPF